MIEYKPITPENSIGTFFCQSCDKSSNDNKLIKIVITDSDIPTLHTELVLCSDCLEKIRVLETE